MRELVTRGLGQMRLQGEPAVIKRLQVCHVEEGADRGFHRLWDAGWKVLGGRFPAASQRLFCRSPDVASALVCVCVCVSRYYVSVCVCVSVSV